jgi:hypothetical protein
MTLLLFSLVTASTAAHDHIVRSYKLIIGDRHADWMLQTGALATAEKAAAIGLVDEASDCCVYLELGSRARVTIFWFLFLCVRVRTASHQPLCGILPASVNLSLQLVRSNTLMTAFSSKSHFVQRMQLLLVVE